MKDKLHRGAKVTMLAVDFDGEIVAAAHGRITYAHRGRLCVRSVGMPVWQDRGRLPREDEGRTWVRGWDTVEALAFKAQVALLVSK